MRLLRRRVCEVWRRSGAAKENAKADEEKCQCPENGCDDAEGRVKEFVDRVVEGFQILLQDDPNDRVADGEH